MTRTRRIVKESTSIESNGGDRRGGQAGKTVRAGGPAWKTVQESSSRAGSGAKSKQTARRSTGGKAPRRALARAAARVIAGVNERVVQMNKAPGTSKYARDLSWSVKLAGAESIPPNRADLDNWNISVKGFLVAFRGTRRTDATP